MEDDVFLSGFGRANQQQQPQEYPLYTDTVGIFVDPGWGSSSQTGIQLCPALFISSAANIPKAVKHIYSRLAAAASEVDQGVPHLLLSLVGTGNSFSFENSDRLVRGLAHLVGRCALWLISSGEQNDPLAVAITAALRSTLAGHSSSSDSSGMGAEEEEILLMVVNSADVRHVGVSSPPAASPARLMADARLNTLYLVWAQSGPSEKQMLLFRACTAVKLANPPPALLIGVPEERSSATGLGPFLSQAQTPIGGPSNSPAILLPSIGPSAERRPLPLVLFCGATLGSLVELLAYVQCGVPALVVQDISELCVVLKAAFLLFQSAGFEHAAFEFWLGRELRMVALATSGHCTKSDLEEAKQMLCQLLLTVSTSEHSLLAFMPARELDKLGEQALDLLVRSASDVNDLGRGLELAVKIGQPRTLNSIRLEGLLSEEQLAGLLRAALTADDRLEVLSALLDQNMPLRVGSDLLMGWLADTRDQYFFSAIILGHCLGMPPGQLRHLDTSMAREFSLLMGQLCGGISQCLFPVESFSASPGSSQSMVADPERGLRLLAAWALLLHRPQLVLLCCAYSPEPMALCLALAKAARTLANRSQAWIFYEQSLRRLGHQLAQFAVQLLDTAYRQDATKAYAALCRPLPAFRHLTLPQLAFETNCRDFIAHECCQRWLLRLLYGRIQIRAVWRHFCLPNWLKILLSALLVWPIAIWIRPRLEKAHGNAGKGMMGSRRPISPTVALLEDGRLEKKVQRSSSVRSGHFGGSGHLVGDPRRHSTTMGDALQQHLANGAAGVEADAVHQGTNDDSTLTDSFLPSASQMREEGGGGGRSSRAADLDCRRHRGEQQREAEAILLMQQQRPTGSRRQSPDRRSLMFFGDGASGGGDSFTGRQRRRSRASSSRLLALNATDGPGQHLGAFSPAGGARLCPTSLLLFYSTPITKFWLYLAFRLLYLLLMGLAVVQAGCFLSGWPEQLLWLWALCWLLDSAWVLACRAQLGDWRQHGWAIFDLVACTAFLLSLLGMRISGWPSGYVLRALWALFLLFECHKTVFLFAPLSPVLGPMLVRIRLMLTRDLVNFLLLSLPLVAASAVAIKATLYPDLSPQPPQMSESFGWTLRQLFTTDLDVLHQSAECQRQLLPERRPFCQALGGYANPRCPAQHWLASFTLFHFLLFVKLLCWPILFALFARTARRVEEEAEQLWRFQLYALASGFSLRPCLPPPLTPLFLVLLACCRFGTGGLSCLLQQRGGINSSDGAGMTSSDHPDVADHGPPHGANRKFSTVYRNPSVLPARGRPLSGYWRRLAIGLWKTSHPVKSTQSSAQNPADLHAQTHQQSDKLLLGFHALRQQLLEKEGRQSWEEQEMDSTPETEEKNANSPPTRLKIRPQCRPWLHLLPDYRPNWHSQPADQFPSDMQKYVDDCSAQGLLDLAGQWRQRRLDNFFALADDWTHRQAGMSGGVLLSGKGLPLNPRGRTGLAGRGSLARFGPNRMFFYAIFRQKAAGGDVQVLVQQPSGQLPSRWALSSGRPMVDEFLAQLLLQLGLPDPEIHALSSKTALSPGQRDGSVAQLDIDENGSEKPLLDNSAQETDNAWVERRLWAVNLSGFSQLHQLAEGGDLAWIGGHRLSQTAERRFLDKAVAAFGKQEGEMAMAEEN